jgi:hypothetical protein
MSDTELAKSRLLVTLLCASLAFFTSFAVGAEEEYEDLSIQTPECGSEEATELIVSQLNYEIESGLAMLGYGAAAAGMRIFEVVDAEEIFFDQASGFRACLAKSRHKNGFGLTGYTIEWESKRLGYFRATVANPGALSAAYGKQQDASE